jgi:hypothetical protein
MFARRLAAALAALALLAVAPATAAAKCQHNQTDLEFVIDHDLNQPDMV